MNFNTIRIYFYNNQDSNQGEALEVRIRLLINDCATFSSYTVPIVAGYLCFPILHPLPLIDYSLKHFEPCVVLRLKLL